MIEENSAFHLTHYHPIASAISQREFFVVFDNLKGLQTKIFRLIIDDPGHINFASFIKILIVSTLNLY